MESRIHLALLASFAVCTVLPPGLLCATPQAARPGPPPGAAGPEAPRPPDDYPFDPPEFRLRFEATYFTEEMHKLTKQGLYAQAEPYARRALQKMAMLPGQDPAVTVCRMNLADVCLRLGKLEEAEHHYRLCLRFFTAPRPTVKGVLGDNEPIALCLNKLAMACLGMGRVQEAEHLGNQALTIVQSKRGNFHPQIAVCLTTLGQIYRATGRMEQAEQLFRSCVQIRETKLGKDHLDTASSLSNLGELYVFLRRLRDAEPLLAHCLRIRELKLGPKHVDVAEALSNLAELCQLTGRYVEAAKLSEGALQIREEKLGPNHPDVATSLENLAAAYEALGRPTEDLLQRSRTIRAAAGGRVPR